MTVAIASNPADLVAAAQRGDRRAFEALYRKHVGAVYGLCLRLCGDPTVADDVTQEVFVRAWRKLDSFRGDAPFGAWLRRLAVNAALNDRRSHTRRLARVVPVEAPERTGARQTPGKAMDLERAVAALPPKSRHVFVLAAVEGWTHAEVGRELGMPEGSSKALLYQARKSLREALS